MRNLKICAAVLAALVMMLACFAFAQEDIPASSGTCGETLTWQLESSGILTIYGTGAMAEYSSAAERPWHDQAGSICRVVLEDGVSSIGAYAFAGCTALERIDIPASVEQIGDKAFEGSSQVCIYAETGGFAVEWCDANGMDCIVKVLSGAASPTCQWLLHGRDNQYTLTYSGEGWIADVIYDYHPLYSYLPYTKTLVIEEGISSISNNVFAACEFETVHLPASLTLVGNGAFSESAAKVDVYYPGTFFEAATVHPCTIVNGLWHCSDYTVPGKMGTHEDENSKYAYAISPEGDFIVRGTGELDSADSSIVHADIGGGITSLADSAFGLFSGCKKLETVVLGDGIQKIGIAAFSDCTALKSINLPDGLAAIGGGAFMRCTSLESIVIPESVTKIDVGAFNGCTSLKSMILYSRPESFEYALQDTASITSAGPIGSGCDFQFAWTDRIPDYAFYRCLGLKTIVIPDTVVELGVELFRDCFALETVQLPDALETLPAGIFRDCTSLKDFELPSGLKRIDDGAFCGCTALVCMTIPENVTSLGEGVFLFATSMTDVYLPDCIAECGDENIPFNNYTFVYHYSADSLTAQTLKGTFFVSPALPDYKVVVVDDGIFLYHYLGSDVDIELPSDVDGISVTGLWDTFYRNSELLSVVIPDSVKFIDSDTFCYCGSLERVEMSKNLEYLGVNAFAFCHKLQSIELPDGLKTIDWGALQLCNSMTELYIPDSVEVIGDYALNFCEKLEELHLPANLKELGAMALSCCYELTEITIPDGVTELKEGLFNEDYKLTHIYLPDGITAIHASVIGEFAALNEGWNDKVACYCRIGTTTMRTMFDGGIDIFRSPSDPDWEIQLLVQENGEPLPMLSRYYGSDTVVTVPAAIDGTAIPATMKTFMDNAGIRRAVLSEGIISVEYDTFSGCTSLCDVELPDSLLAIETGAFRNCSALKMLEIPENVSYIGGVSAFEGCAEGFTLYVFPGSFAEGWCIENNFPYRQICAQHTPQTVSAVAATCTEPGNEGNTVCASCGKLLSEGGEIPALGHNECTLEAQEPGCTLPGHAAGTYCDRCGETLSGGDEIPASGHSPAVAEAIPPTHVTTGLTEGSFCSRCSSVITAQEEIPVVQVPVIALPGDLQVIEPQAFAGGAFQCVVIPRGCLQVADRAFENNQDLRFVEFQDSAAQIAETAFDGCREDMIIVAPAGSRAEAFAREHGIYCVVR